MSNTTSLSVHQPNCPILSIQRIGEQWLALAYAGSMSGIFYLSALAPTQCEHWQRMENEGDADASFLLAMHADDMEQEARLRVLRDRNYTLAIWQLGKLFVQRDTNKIGEYWEGIKLFQAAASMRCNGSLYDVAMEMVLGDDEKYEAEGRRIVMELAETGLGVAMCSCGSWLSTTALVTRGRERDQIARQAVETLRKAAGLGNPMAARELESIYRNGRIVQVNSQESDYWKKRKDELQSPRLGRLRLYGMQELLNAGVVDPTNSYFN